MEVSIVRLGNSKAIVLPEALLRKYNIGRKVVLELHDDHMVLKPLAEPRKNWEAAFKNMHQQGEDKLLIDSVPEGE